MTRYYHGGPAGLGRILPGIETGNVSMPLTRGPRVPGRVFVTTELIVARAFAGQRAWQDNRPFGAVYLVEPEGELRADFDMPRCFHCERASVMRLACLVRASEFPEMRRAWERWIARQRVHHGGRP